MGNSNITLQQVADEVAAQGDLILQLPASGWSTQPALSIANRVMADMLSERFPWKWNRLMVTPFLNGNLQQDYAQVGLSTLGWIENAVVVDINNTALPKPTLPVEAVRDMARSSDQWGRPSKICWLLNEQLVRDVWPGAGVTITNPLGAVAMPANPILNILDANGNILVLTTFGVTGGSAPAAAASSAAGVTVADGTCVWKVAAPSDAGFRIWPITQLGTVYQFHVTAQKKPVLFTAMSQKLDPIPDDHYTHFATGYRCYGHQYSVAPAVRARFPDEHKLWMLSLSKACKRDDREKEDAAFVPASTIIGGGGGPVGPGTPYGPFD